LEELVTVSERLSGSVTVLDVKGALTLTDGAEHLHDKVRSLLQQGQKHLLVNLGDVPYIDSAGLGELVQAYATTSRQGGQLKLLNATKRIQDLLVITKLATVFDLFDNEAAAVNSFT
jgi:anti-sigma B factor antagonist